MGWFSRKQPKAADDALVERTLAFAQEVAQEKPEDEQALLAMIDGIKMMPPKPAQAADAIDALEAVAPSPSPNPIQPEQVLPATLPPISLPSMSLPQVSFAKVEDAPLRAPASVAETIETAPVITRPSSTSIATTDLPVTIETPPAPPLPQPVLRTAVSERARQPEPRRPAGPPPPQSEMRREIAQRVQNFKAHQQRLNDEREARIKKIYADMQARLEKSGAQKSPPVS